VTDRTAIVLCRVVEWNSCL